MIERLWRRPAGRALIGFTLGYFALNLLVGAVVELLDDAKRAREEGHEDGHTAGYLQAYRELGAEVPEAWGARAGDVDEDQDQDADVDADRA